MRFRPGLICIALLALMLLSGIGSYAEAGNLIENPGFEDGESYARYWESSQWKTDAGVTEFKLDNEVKRSGEKSACVINTQPNDARYRQEVKLESGTVYRVNCWVKTENVGADGKGANISIDGKLDSSMDIKGTSQDWQQLELYCRTGKDSEKVFFTFGLGGYSSINSGTAWFDDISIEKVDSLPAGVNAVDLSYKAPAAASGTGQQDSSKTGYRTPLLLFTVLFLGVAVWMYFYLQRKNPLSSSDKSNGAYTYVLIAIMVSGFIVRIIAAGRVEGFSVDMNCFKAWASAAARDLPNFYNSDMFVDYPPFYVYILFLIGKIVNIQGMAEHFNVLVKLPSILADLATAWLLYRLAQKRLDGRMALLVAGVYAFNPAVFINSTLWGQVDSFFTLMIVAGLVLTASGRLNYSTAIFTAAVLMKPQAIIILPVLFFELLRRKNAVTFVKALLTGLGTAILIILPFSFSQEPLWIIKLFIKTGSEYPYASLNAFNLFAMLGANNAPVGSSFLGLNYGIWGFVFDAAIAVFIGYLYYKGKNLAALPFISALILNAGAFVLSARMHERYLFPAVALALLAFIYIKDRRLVALFMVFTVTVFANTHMVLYRFLETGNPHLSPDDTNLILFSLVNVLAFSYLIKVGYDIVIKDKRAEYVKTVTSAAGSTKTGKSVKPSASDPVIIQAEPVKRIRANRVDLIVMSAMTLVYTIVALVNLGSFKAPNTFWEPARAGESVTLDLGRRVDIGRIAWYCGINEARYDSSNKYIVEYMDDNGKYVALGSLDKRDVYTWKHMDVNASARRLRFTVQSPHGTINELGIFEAGSEKPLKGVKVAGKDADPEDRGKPENLVDEQQLVQYWSSYKTGTHFDEVYHARTAYEYLNRIEPMEWTHPPLGKIIISLGVAIFGMNPFGWRIMGTLFGAAMIPLMYLFGLKVFNKRLYGFIAAFLMMFDFMHFAQTRIATIDVYGTFFIILMYYFMYDYFVNKSYAVGFRKSLRPLFWSGLFFGIGAASKWIGLYAGGGLALLFFMAKIREYMDYRSILNDRKAKKPEWTRSFIELYIVKTLLYCVLFFVAIPGVIYALSYIPYMMVPGPGHGLEVILNNQKAMFEYHSRSVLGASHGFASQWWSWPFILKPIWFYKGEGMASGMASSIVSMGNPAVWWGGVIAVVAIASAAVVKCSRKSRSIAAAVAALGVLMLILPGVWRWGVVLLFIAAFIAIESMDRRLGVIFAAMAFQYLPWVFVERLAFIYHFFSTVPFLILCVVYVIKWIIDRQAASGWGRNAAWIGVGAYLAVTVALFIMFYPVLSGMVVSQNYIDSWLRWFKDSHNQFLWFENVTWYF